MFGFGHCIVLLSFLLATSTASTVMCSSNEIGAFFTAADYAEVISSLVKPDDVVLRLGWDGSGVITEAIIRQNVSRLVVVLYGDGDLEEVSEFASEHEDIVDLYHNVPLHEISLEFPVDVLVADDLDGIDVISKGLAGAIQSLREAGLLSDKVQFIPQHVEVLVAVASQYPDESLPDIDDMIRTPSALEPYRKRLDLLSEVASMWTYDFREAEYRKDNKIRRAVIRHFVSRSVQDDEEFGFAVWVIARTTNAPSAVDKASPNNLSKFIPAVEPWYVNAGESTVKVYGATNDYEFKFSLAANQGTESKLGAAEIELLSGVRVPEDVILGNAKNLFTFVRTDCQEVTDLYLVRLGSKEVFLEQVIPQRVTIVQGMTQNDRLELRRDGHILAVRMLKMTQFHRSPLIDVWLDLDGCVGS